MGGVGGGGSHFYQNLHLCLNNEEEAIFQSKGHLSSDKLVCKPLEKQSPQSEHSSVHSASIKWPKQLCTGHQAF